MNSKVVHARELRDPRALPDELRRLAKRCALSAEAKDIIEHAADELFGLQNAHAFNAVG
jgi:prophage maintenance system killer protein